MFTIIIIIVVTSLPAPLEKQDNPMILSGRRSSYLLLCLLSGSVIASNAHAGSLDDAVRAAMFEHPSVSAAKSDVDIAEQQRREEYSGYFPELSVSSSAGRIYGDNATSRGLSVTRGAGYSWLGEGSASVSQMIFDGRETPSRVNAADARITAADNALADIRESLALRAAQTYINLVRAKKGLTMIEEHNKIVTDYLGRISDMVDEGASDEAELQQARDIKIILEGIKTDFEGQVATAEAQYVEVTGKSPDDVLAEPPSRLDVLPKDAAQAIGAAKAEHPAIEAAKLASKAASYDVTAEQGTLYPDVTGELSYLKSDKDDVIGGELVDGRALVRMNWNFATGGEQLARIKKTRYAHEQSRSRIAEMERQIERDIRMAYSELETSGRQVKLLKERMALNEKLFGTYQSQFEAAQVNLLQLMQSHNQLFNTKLEAINGEYRNLGAQYAVLAGMGRLQKSLNLAAGPSANAGPVNGAH